MKDQLEAIISNPLSTESQKGAAQAMLDSLTAPATLAPVAEPNPASPIRLDGHFKYFPGVVKDGESPICEFSLTISPAYATELRKKHGSLNNVAANEALNEKTLFLFDTLYGRTYGWSEKDEKCLQEIRLKFPEEERPASQMPN
jgi:hypothetical protein